MIRLRLLINILLFLTVVILILYLTQTQTEKVVVEEVLLSNIDPQKIDRIQVKLKNKENIIFQKKEKHWYMISPFNLLANPNRMQTMLNFLQAYSYTKFGTDNLELEKFSLLMPELSIVFNDYEIVFGAVNPLEPKLRYVMAQSNVYLVRDGLYQQLLAPVTFFLNKKILPHQKKIKSIELPKGFAEQEEKFIKAWQVAEALNVLKYEGVEAVAMVKIVLTSGENIVYEILRYEPDLILARPDMGIQYQVDSEVANQLLPVSVDNL